MKNPSPPSLYAPGWIRSVFDRIAGRYDLLNDALSVGIHRTWKRSAVSLLGNVQGKLVLDAATGTGDIAIRLASKGAKVVAVDFSEAMLRIAKKKSIQISAIQYLQEDVLKLSFPDAFFDHAIITFGVRNFDQPGLGIRQLWRVLKPKGLFVVMEFGGWSEIPLLGSAIAWVIRWLGSDREAYTHLVQSSFSFPAGDRFVDRYLNDLPGMQSCQIRRLFFGLVFLYSATKCSQFNAKPGRPLES